MFAIVFLFAFITSIYTLTYHVNDLNFDRLRVKRFFDLGYALSNETIYFPGQKQFQLHKEKERVQGPGYSYSAYTYSAAEHGGTHLDAPFHFNPAGWTVDKIPESSLIDVPAFLVDVSKEVNDSPRPSEFRVDVKHIIQREVKLNRIVPFGGVLLIHTGWSKFWPNKEKYLGWDNATSAEPVLSFPGISEHLAQWLINERHIVGIGIDTASIDAGSSETFGAHVLLSKKEIYNIENVANLHLLSNSTQDNCLLHLFVMPLKIVGGTGAPARILAYCRDNFYGGF